MQIKYTIHCQEFTEESLEYGEPSESYVETEGVSDLKGLVSQAVNGYGITPRDANDATHWWESVYPTQDRDLFENGVSKYYSLHIPCLSALRRQRINKAIRLMWRGVY